MLKNRIFSKRLHQTFVDSGVSGVIHDHDDKGNAHAIRRMLDRDGYYDFGIKIIHQAERLHLSRERVTGIMATSLGSTVERFEQDGPGYINPDLTIERLAEMLDWVDSAIGSGQKVILATGHPGSMMQFYVRLSDYVRQRNGRLFELSESLKIQRNYWVDSVCGVITISDLGSLLHSHDHRPMETVLKVAGDVGLVVADHGFAGGAVNAGIKTVGLHDVDDPGIPVAAALGADVLCVPINDNQLNLSTDRALAALMANRL